MSTLSNSASAPVVFTFNTNTIRVITIDGDPWFVAADVCEILGIVNSRDAVCRLDDDERNTVVLPDGIRGRGNPNVNIISESGLYTLVLRSDKPEAKPFRKWVTSEVLPSIRRTGRYEAPTAHPLAPERITPSQLQQIESAIWWAAQPFHIKGSASWAFYSRLRHTFGVDKSFSYLPATRFEEAFQLVKELEKECFSLRGVIMDVEAKFLRRVIRGGLPFDAQYFELELAKESAALLENRQQRLNLAIA